MKKPFRIGLPLRSPNAMKLGLGIVSLTPNHFENISDNLDDYKENDSDCYPLQVTPLRSDYYPTGIRTKLPNIIIERLNYIPSGMNKNNIGYNYYHLDGLKQILLESIESIEKDSESNYILDIICKYCGISKV